MLKIRAIKLEVNTNHGAFGATYEFTGGLNIIRADNTTGKSTLFQAILYGLGVEELLDGKNEKTMQAVLKDEVEYPKNTFNQVISSFVYLEIENKEVVTTKRSVKHPYKNGKLIEVFKGSLIVNNEQDLTPQPMYLHDAGGASNKYFGFHSFLETFLGWNLPDVQGTNGESRKLYIQSVFPAFIIEQKVGWSDFLATVPFFGQKNVKSRLVEFILGLGLFELETRKQELIARKQKLIEEWRGQVAKIKSDAGRGAVNISNLNNYPEPLSAITPIRFYVIKDTKTMSLSEYFLEELNELEELEKKQIKIGTEKNIKEIEEKLRNSEEKLNKVSLAYEIVANELSIEKRKLERYEKQLIEVEEDLKKNKGAKKVYDLGTEVPIKLAEGICPTCNQEVKDTLLPQDLEQIPMRIDENIKYLEAQKKMIEAYLKAHSNNIVEKNRLYNGLYTQINQELRPLIRQLKKELVEDVRTPSEIEIENKIKKRSRVDFYRKLIDELENHLLVFQDLSKSWVILESEYNKLPKDAFSVEDRRKIELLENSFKRLVSKFGYRSKRTDAIKISMENYLPEIQSGEGQQFRYNIRFDSSASDLIRSIWAYSCSLFKVAESFHNTNHPLFLAFDEPAQQNMANEDFRSFLQELSTYQKCQVLVFASFNQSEELYKETTEGINFNLHWIKERLIKPLEM